MRDYDFDYLKLWLEQKGYCVGDSSVAKSLRELADYFDD